MVTTPEMLAVALVFACAAFWVGWWLGRLNSWPEPLVSRTDDAEWVKLPDEAWSNCSDSGDER